MGLLSNFFGKSDPRNAIIGAGLALANETERVYRNHLETRRINGSGLLKARLLSATFTFAAFKIVGCAKSEEDVLSFFQACSGIGMKPFTLPDANPTISQREAEAIAGPFMSDVFGLISSELQIGPSDAIKKTAAFQGLVKIYHQCLAESVGEPLYETQMKRDLEIFAEGVIWTHFRFLADTIQQITQ